MLSKTSTKGGTALGRHLATTCTPPGNPRHSHLNNRNHHAARSPSYEKMVIKDEKHILPHYLQPEVKITRTGKEMVVLKEVNRPPPFLLPPPVVVSNPRLPFVPKPFPITAVTLTHFEHLSDAVYYVLKVTADNRMSYFIKRRFSDFERFHEAFWQNYSHCRAELPPKNSVTNFFFSPNDQKLETRRQGLEKYFSTILEYAKNCQSKGPLRKAIKQFLEFRCYFRAFERAARQALDPPPMSLLVSQEMGLPAAFVIPIGRPSTVFPSDENYTGWEVEPFKQDYDAIFAAHDITGEGKLTPDIVREILLQTHLETIILAQIWELSDIDKDGLLDNDEFAVAMYLSKNAVEGFQIPSIMPASMIPPSKTQCNEANCCYL